ncbi:MAG: hypothetical protein AAB250_08005, partial [Bdellovibrionota bacterium]
MLLAMAAPFLLFLPHYISFAHWAPLSGRSQHSLFDLPNVDRVDFGGLLDGIVIMMDQIHIHIDYTIVQTIVFVALLGLVVNSSIRERSKWLGRFETKVFLLGLIPTLFVFALLGNVDWLTSVPYFKSTDITRFFWFGLLFVHVGFALVLQGTLTAERRSYRFAAFLVVTGVAYALRADTLMFDTTKATSPYRTTDEWLIITSFISLTVLLIPFVTRVPKRYAWLVLVALILPKLIVFNFISRISRSTADQFGPIPPGLEKVIPPFSRMASLYPFGESPDQRLALNSIFGSNARSIILSSELRDTFERVNAVQRDYVTYNFVASAIDRLDPYGIRYIVTRNQNVSSPLWKPVADLKWR